MPMKVFSVNSSPRTGEGSITELMLNHLVRGMQAAGAEVCSVNLREKTIKPCQGCFSCWTQSLGRCIQPDDMTLNLLPELIGSNLLVYATPLYFRTMNAAMSIFRERLLPLSLPFSEKRDGKRSFLPGHRLPPVVWLSVCALSELSEFDALSNFLHSTHHADTPIIAEIYRTSSETLRHPVFKETLNDILGATTRAGKELVRSMKISQETLARIRQPLADPEILSLMGNLVFKSCMAENVSLKKFMEAGMTPRPDSIEAFMAYAAIRFNTAATVGRKLVLQFIFSGEIEKSCYFNFENGNTQAAAGTSPDYDIAIDTPFELWMDIMTGKADGREMFMNQKFTVEGDLSLLQEIFRVREK
jgi:hypothetical protein